MLQKRRMIFGISYSIARYIFFTFTASDSKFGLGVFRITDFSHVNVLVLFFRKSIIVLFCRIRWYRYASFQRAQRICLSSAGLGL